VHCKPLLLPTAEVRSHGITETPSTTQKRVVDRPPEGRHGAIMKARVVVFHGAVDVGIESIRELVDEFLCAAEAGSFADLVTVMCEHGITKSDVLAYLRPC